jgi:hypothetical protein
MSWRAEHVACHARVSPTRASEEPGRWPRLALSGDLPVEGQGLIGSRWAVTENNRKARDYTLTARGRERLADERLEWQRLSEAVNRMLATRTV